MLPNVNGQGGDSDGVVENVTFVLHKRHCHDLEKSLFVLVCVGGGAELFHCLLLQRRLFGALISSLTLSARQPLVVQVLKPRTELNRLLHQDSKSLVCIFGLANHDTNFFITLYI